MNDTKDEKLFPISINSNLCVRCERCMYSCPQKAIFFNDSMRYVNYDKCKGCLKCVNVCEHGAIEVISIEQGQLKGFSIDSEKCALCKICLKEDFCLQNLFELQKDKNGKEWIIFRKNNFSECNKCLNCFKNCPNSAILPEII
ncbi:MAG: 4Fe-4S binding protein [Candidatus Lokiarchaeota archaeon]|nr:4Fe-4S binding protein [Candidatus Lokiarchaeota archaeon]